MPTATRTLRRSLRSLRELSFNRYEVCSDVVRSWFALKDRIDAHPLSSELWRVHDWLISPLTLQAVDYCGLARHLVDTLRADGELDADIILLLGLIEESPSSDKIAAMKAHEAAVAEGRYDRFSREPLRYRELELALEADPLLKRFWNRIKSRYARQFRPNSKGVMRRTLARERGFDCRHGFNWSRKADRFQITFDALCHRWCLYGFENENPLALKLTANPTPHGTMIFVPRGMSLAANGTFVWKAIAEVHKAHGASRQGGKLFLIRQQQREDRKLAQALDREAKRLRLRGPRRYEYILERMKQLPNRVRWLKRLLHGS